MFIFLFKTSKDFTPEYSILIKCNPIKPIIKGKIKLKIEGKKNIKFILKNEFRKTSRILKEIKNRPKYKYV